MLPISDVHFAFCGIATVAATLGYACARRAVLSLSSPIEPSRADVEAGQPEERSLKRKLDDSDEHDVDAEEKSRPMKRNKTPPADQHALDDDFNQEWEVIVAPPPPYEQAIGLSPEPLQDHNAPPAVEQAIQEPAPPTFPETPAEQAIESQRCSTPQPTPLGLSPNEPETPPAHPVTPPRPAATPRTGPVNALSAFSGSSSPFASYSKTSGASPFAISGQSVRGVPAWRRANEDDSDVFGPGAASTANALALSPNDTISSASVTPGLEKSKETQSAVKPTTYVTGEEDEMVEAELKGAKLFVKRGQKEFTDGIYGHIKILTRRSVVAKNDGADTHNSQTEAIPRTRLLFRRDPLGQVSMNVGLHPTVRCHFESAENILRVVLMEPITTDGKGPKEDVVVYAFKPGRAQKTDFQSFAKTLCDHEGLESRAITSSTSADREAAAS